MAGIVVYTLSSCPTCIKLKESWVQQEIEFEERPVDENQGWLDEARQLADVVPIIVSDEGVRVGFEGEEG